MIEIDNISKSFNGKPVLDHISFNISSNKATTVAGPNGIGKTTLLNILCGILAADTGSIHYNDIVPSRDIFAVLSGDKNLYAKNTVKENVYFVSILKGLKKAVIQKNINTYSPFFSLYETIQNKLYEQLSFGQKRLVTIFSAVVSGSKFIIMDEPTEGLDLWHKKQLLDIITYLKKDTTFILTSHDYEFVAHISDKTLFLNDGLIVSENDALTPEEFLDIYQKIYGKEVIL